MPRAHQRHAVAAVIALSLVALTAVSKVLGPKRTARVSGEVPLPAAELTWRALAERGEPVVLSVREDVRSLCEDYGLPVEPFALEAPASGEGNAAALEGLAACVVEGPMASYELELFGPTEFPGKRSVHVESSAPADSVRALLSTLGVPFENIVTRDQGIDQYATSHAALTVVVAVGAALPPGAPEAS